jgi:hypothetical protein
LAVTITVVAVSATTLLLILGAIITPSSIVFAKKHSNGGNDKGNDQKQKDDSSNGSNTPSEQPTNSGDQPPSTDGNPPPPPTIQPLLPVNPQTSELDCNKTPNDPSCPPRKTVAPVDCIANPTDPSCPTAKPVPPVDCAANPTDLSCPPPPNDCEPSYPSLCLPKGPLGNHNCIDRPERCPPPKPVPPVDCAANPTDLSCPPPPNDCEPSYPSLCLVKGTDLNCGGSNGLIAQGKHDFIVKEPDPYDLDRDGDGIGCEDGHPNTGGNGNGNGNNGNNGNNVHVTVHKHITSNSNPTSMVTKNTKITDQLTVGQAIDGCKDLTKKSLDNALKKSCNIMMAATFNYCMTHTKLWMTDSNICSDNLYLKNVQRYIAENVNLKLFPATIYNIRP